jgi:hypothetical protein
MATQIPLTTVLARIEGDTYAAIVCLVQGPFFVAPCQTLIVRFTTNESLKSAYRVGRHSGAHSERVAHSGFMEGSGESVRGRDGVGV